MKREGLMGCIVKALREEKIEENKIKKIIEKINELENTEDERKIQTLYYEIQA